MRFKGKQVKILSSILVVSLVLVMVIQAVMSTLYFSQGSKTNYGLLGTQEALGSPITDPNFMSDDWNKWEMLTWGIFLSNFAVPLVDDYESAFNTNSTRGSKGSGFKALQFGTGSDPANAETIAGLLSYGVQQQKTAGLDQIYVSYSDITRDKIDKKAAPDSNTAEGSGFRQATFKDLFLSDTKAENTSWAQIDNVAGLNNQKAQVVPIDGDSMYEGWLSEWGKSERYVSVATINEGSLPTFYVKYSGGYEKVFDYTDGWDAQILTAFIARVACGDFKGEFKELFDDMWSKSNDLKLGLDTFGNIVVQYEGSRRIVLPASINQHLTDSPKINLVSSMIFNGLNSDVSGSELTLRGQQSVSGWFNSDKNVDVRFGGLPALGSHLAGMPEGLLTFYYDLDTVAYNTYFNGGTAANGTKTVENEVGTPYNTHYGKAVKQLFDLDAKKKVGNPYIFKLEASNMDKFDFTMFADSKAGDSLKTMLSASGQIANIAGSSVKAEVLTKIKTNNSDEDIFGKPVIIPVQMDAGRTGSSPNSSGAARSFTNFVYDAYQGGKTTTAGEIPPDYVTTLLQSGETDTMAKFKGAFLGTKDKAVSSLLAGFTAERTDLFTLNVDPANIIGASMGDKSNPFAGMAKTESNGKPVADILFDKSGSMDYFPGRLVKAYPVSETMRAVGNILGVREGTEFGLYSTFIYMTYLDWYGVKLDKLSGKASSEFNPRIFDGTEDMLKVDINSIAKIKSEEDKKKEVLNYTYMMLHPTDGKAYRNEMMNSWINNLVYDNYQKIVYGNSTSFHSNITPSIATRNATGFLSLDSYSDNFMTAWFISIYPKVAMIIIAVSLVLIIVLGLLKGKKASWYLISIVVVVNTVLIVPSAGEVTPLIANNFVQRIFKGKMTYWAVSESVTNAAIEADSVKKASISNAYMGNLSKDEQSRVLEMVKTLNVVYLDRALMVKQDISRKVTQTQGGNYAEVQKLRSARWMLPMIMRQFTANDNSASYVYLPLGDMYDDLSNMYWYYKPEDAEFSSTLNGQQVEKDKAAVVGDPIPLTDRQSYYPDYRDTSTSASSSGDKEPYRSEAYSRGKSVDEMPHTYSYLLQTNANPLNRKYGFNGEYKGNKSFKEYVKTSTSAGKAQSFGTTATALEQQAGTYDRFDRSTLQQSYGYLWATESPYHYFYESIKDSFSPDITLGALVGKLQGQYNTNEEGVEVRTSFMHSSETGNIKDIVDLQEMMTNMVPYLYEMQITAGGLDGKSGVLGDAKIEDYAIYENNYKAWLFRSNWVTKLMESPELTKPAVVRDTDGNKITIKNPMLIDEYPSNRPMIYSQAQMKQLGLKEADLNLVELKCIKVNQDISRRWTLLLNYANVKGMTKEVMIRQLTTEAILAFDTEFSPKGLFNSAYQMYPNSLDLRAISFDSVMKMLMLNVTKDTSYIYGDTMQNVVADSDMFSAILLLVAAFICSYLIPLIRNITMGLIFYLGFLAIIYALLSNNKQKAKVSAGYLISNVIFLGITIVYYSTFSVLMAITSTDAVLTVQSVQVNTGNPVWSFILIIGVSVAYVLAMFKMIDFCFKNYRDMGMEVYASMTGLLADKFSGGLANIGAMISGIGGGGSTKGTKGSNKGTSNSNKGTSNSKFSGQEDVETLERSSTDKVNRNRRDSEVDRGSMEHKYGGTNVDNGNEALEIDREIEKGSNRQHTESNTEHKNKDKN